MSKGVFVVQMKAFPIQTRSASTVTSKPTTEQTNHGATSAAAASGFYQGSTMISDNSMISNGRSPFDSPSDSDELVQPAKKPFSSLCLDQLKEWRSCSSDKDCKETFSKLTSCRTKEGY